MPERLPPRMDIRRGAPLELPHVLLLIDDDKDAILPALGEIAKKADPLYSTHLMMNSGSITGWFLDVSDQNSGVLTFLTDQLDELYSRSYSRYDHSFTALVLGANPFLFAVGDGNHSLAAAKGIWEEYKKSIGSQSLNHEEKTAALGHPCRYALVEIENIYDPAIQFEPIHRLVFDIGFDETVSLLSRLPDFSCVNANSAQELANAVRERFDAENTCANCFGVISQGRYALIKTSASGIATACLQPLLDSYAKDNPQLIDYIHDEKELFRLAEASCEKRKTCGLLLPPVKKSGLFETVARFGPLPRKSFSMGHSCEKRFYLESRYLT